MDEQTRRVRALRARSIKKAYRSKVAVADVSLSLASGEIVGLLGPNGAGKTTCFYMIVGLIKADEGTITVDGDDLTNAPVHRRARAGIGYLPQEASVFRSLSTKDNLRAILELRKDLNRDTRKVMLEFAAARVPFGWRAQSARRPAVGR